MNIDPMQDLMLSLETIFGELDMDVDPQLIGVSGYSDTFKTQTWVRLNPLLQQALASAYESYTILLEMEEEPSDEEE